MKIIYVGGGKGGVGKSVMSMVALHCEIEAGNNPVLIETDTANPDVYKAYKDLCECYCYDIDEEDGTGWTSVFDTFKKIGDRPIIINSGARNQKTILNYGDLLNDYEDLTTLWVVNHELDGLVLLKNYLESIKQKVCVIKNLYGTKENRFNTFNNSKLNQNGIKSVFMPEAVAGTGISRALKIERCPISKLNEVLSYGERMLARKWIANAPLCYIEAMKIASKYDAK